MAMFRCGGGGSKVKEYYAVGTAATTKKVTIPSSGKYELYIAWGGNRTGGLLSVSSSIDYEIEKEYHSTSNADDVGYSYMQLKFSANKGDEITINFGGDTPRNTCLATYILIG